MLFCLVVGSRADEGNHQARRPAAWARDGPSDLLSDLADSSFEVGSILRRAFEASQTLRNPSDPLDWLPECDGARILTVVCLRLKPPPVSSISGSMRFVPLQNLLDRSRFLHVGMAKPGVPPNPLNMNQAVVDGLLVG